MRKFIPAAILALAFAAFGVGLASPAMASTPACAARSSCFYPMTNYGGTPHTVLNTSDEDTWTSVPSSDRVSAWEAGGSDLFLWSEADQVYTCIPGGGNGNPNENPINPGWFYIDYGVEQNCTESLPSGAPGSHGSPMYCIDVKPGSACNGTLLMRAKSIRYKPTLGAIDETIKLVKDKDHVPVRADVLCNFSWGIRGSETGRYHSSHIITKPGQKSYVKCGKKTLDGITERGSVYIWYVDERWGINKGPWHATTIAKKDH